MAAPPESTRRPLRFLAVGVVNTAIDFGLLLGLTVLGMPVLIANTISTGVALAFSFILNRRYTFRAHGSRLVRQAVLFLVFTLIGLWVIQPLVILAVQWLLQERPSGMVALVIAKLAATVASMTWNYLTYSRFVFAPSRPNTDPPADPAETP